MAIFGGLVQRLDAFRGVRHVFGKQRHWFERIQQDGPRDRSAHRIMKPQGFGKGAFVRREMRDEIQIPNVFKRYPICIHQHQREFMNHPIAEFSGPNGRQYNLLAIGIGRRKSALVGKDLLKSLIEIDVHEQGLAQVFDAQPGTALAGFNIFQLANENSELLAAFAGNRLEPVKELFARCVQCFLLVRLERVWNKELIGQIVLLHDLRGRGSAQLLCNNSPPAFAFHFGIPRCKAGFIPQVLQRPVECQL